MTPQLCFGRARRLTTPAASKDVPGTQESLTIRIPVRQKLNLRAID